MIIAFVLTGKLLELRSRHSTGMAIKALMGMQPDEALLELPDGKTRTVPVSQISIDDTLIVRQGDRVPVDGYVTGGNASVDESMLTGESIGVEKETGDAVSAGTIVNAGSIRVKAVKVGSQTELSRIIRAVKKPRVQRHQCRNLSTRWLRCLFPLLWQ